MPKQKTHKGLKDRVRVTKNRKIVRRKAGKSHLLSGKSAKRKRSLRAPASIEGRFKKTVLRKLPGS